MRDSIVTPRNVVAYRHDSIWRIFLYLLLFVLLLSTRTVIETVNFDGISSTIKRSYIEDIETIDDTCIITSESVTCDNQKNNLLLSDIMMDYYVEGRDDLVMQDYDNLYNFVFKGDTLYMIVSGTIIEEFDLDEIIVKDLDFSLQATDSETLYDNLFDNVDHIINGYKNFWAPMLIAIEVLSNMLFFLFFILISAWFLKMRFKVIPFKQLFKMTVYSSTLLYVILIINSLYNLSLFVVILFLIIAVRQNSQLSLELMRRLKKKS